MNKFVKKLKKYYEYFQTKVKLLFLQRTYKSQNVCVKYIWRPCVGSKDLIVVLSSCTRVGVKARYNYMRTLKDCKANQLYILDDFGPDQRGSYYLGRDYTFCEEKATKNLIDIFIENFSISRLIFCGSSKGGYAALNFGVQYKDAIMIVGAPQFYLGTWFGKSETLQYILGDITENKVMELDNHLRNRILNSKDRGTQKVYIHYSINEHTYDEHIVDLLKTLNEAGDCISEDIGYYESHSDVSLYFPKYLYETVQWVLKDMEV